MIRIPKSKPHFISKKTARAIGRTQVGSSDLGIYTENLFAISDDSNEDFLHKCQKQKRVLQQEINHYKINGDFEQVRVLRKNLKEIEDQMVMYVSSQSSMKREQESKAFIERIMKNNKAYIEKKLKEKR